MPGNCFEGARQIVVVSVEPADKVAGRHAKALVDGIGLTAVGFGDPPQMRMTLKNLERVVGGRGVDYNMFG